MTPPAEPTFGPVIITAREIYDAVIRVSAQVATIQTQLAQHTDEHQRRDAEEQSFRKDFSDRLLSLERNRWPLPSLAVLAAVAALIVPFIVKS